MVSACPIARRGHIPQLTKSGSRLELTRASWNSCGSTMSVRVRAQSSGGGESGNAGLRMNVAQR